MKKITVSIIIPAYNAERTIANCLEGLLRQKIHRRTVQIIVVDDGSSDATPSIVRRTPEVFYLAQNHAGPAQARNVGAQHASGEIILFTDSDCEAGPDWILKMTEPFQDPEIMAVKGVYRTKQKEWVARVVQAEYESKYERMKGFPAIDFVDTYSAGFRREILMKASGFNMAFPNASVEDQEFSFRLAELGLKMVFEPSAYVYHQHVTTLSGYFKKKFRIGCWKIPVLQRHPRKIWHDSHTPEILKAQILVSFLALFLLLESFAHSDPRLISLGAGASFCFLGLATLEMKHLLLRNPALGIFSLFVLFLRGLALGAGMIYGLSKIRLHRNVKRDGAVLHAIP